MHLVRDRPPSTGIGVGDRPTGGSDDNDDDERDRPVLGETCVCPRKDGVVCGGHGSCSREECVQSGKILAVCTCDDGWAGRTCEYDITRIEDGVKDRQDKMQGLINATQQMFDRCVCSFEARGGAMFLSVLCVGRGGGAYEEPPSAGRRLVVSWLGVLACECFCIHRCRSFDL